MYTVKEEYYKIIFEEKYSLIVVSFKKYSSGEVIKQFLKELIEIFKKTSAKKFLFDASNFPTIAKNTQNWIILHSDYLSKLNLEKVAIVIPDDKIIKKMLIERMQHDIGVNKEGKMFSSYEEAYKWVTYLDNR